MPARPYQVSARTGVISDYTAGFNQLIVSMATGTGKTYFFVDLYESMKEFLPGKMLVIVHTEELVDQIIAEFKSQYPNLRVDKEMATFHADPNAADIVVASVKSLGRKGTKRIANYDWTQYDKIVVDEAHHTPAASYRNILEASGILAGNKSKLLLGVTATTRRGDGKGLDEYYRRISFVYGMRQAIEDGWLVDIRGYRVKTDTDITNVGTNDGDFNKDALGSKINNPQRNIKIVEAWEKLGEDRQTVGFAATVQHAQDLAAAFKAKGYAFEAIWGEDPEREEKLRRHKAKEIRGLINVGVLVEGYDDWQIACIIHARPTQSESLFTQMTGRGTRLQTGTGNLKELLADPLNWDDGFFIPAIKRDCIVIDVMDNTERHSLMNLPTLMGLPSGLDLQGRSAIDALKQLEELQAENPEIDFSKLLAMDEAEKYIEQVNMFEIRFPEEVEKNSELRWCKTWDGAFTMRIPGAATNKVGEAVTRENPGNVTIRQNLLGKWEIMGKIKEELFRGTRATMEEAFVAADHAIRERAGQLMVLLNRKASWHDKPVDRRGNQFQLLSRLYPGRQWPENLTKGQASYWIDKRLARKAKR